MKASYQWLNVRSGHGSVAGILLASIVPSPRRHSRRGLAPHTDFGSMADAPRMTTTVHGGCQCADIVGHSQKVLDHPTGLMVSNECPKVRREIDRSLAQSVRLQCRIGNPAFKVVPFCSDLLLVVQVDALPITRAWSRSSSPRPRPCYPSSSMPSQHKPTPREPFGNISISACQVILGISENS